MAMNKHFTTLAFGILFVSNPGFAQDDPVNQWGTGTTEKMSHFLPQPAPGLLPHEPWSSGANNKPGMTFGDAVQNWKYLIPRAEQTWWFEDTLMAQKIAAAEKEKSDLAQSEQQNMQSHMAEIQAIQKQYQDLVRQNKITEAQALLPKMQQLTESGDAKSKELDERVATLQSHVRNVTIRIHGNQAVADAVAPAGIHPQQSGAINGHPVFRGISNMLGGPDRPTMYLVIYLGPQGLRNPPVEIPSIVGLKCFVIVAEIQTSTNKAQSDEAVARQMLSTIDYDGLAKMIEP
jgi:hypothetical protein